MTVSVWRIAVEAATYAANDLKGTGAKSTGGRWNSKGIPLVYCATSIALATLETVQYLRSGNLPFNRYLVRVDIPDTVWAARRILDPLPRGWDAIPAGLSAKTAGDSWIAARASALLIVPSVIVPEEQNVLINPSHADAGAIDAVTLKRWIYDPRFFLIAKGRVSAHKRTRSERYGLSFLPGRHDRRSERASILINPLHADAGLLVLALTAQAVYVCGH